MSDKYLVIIDAKGIKKKIKYFLINKANHKLLDIIDKKQSIAINDLQSNPFPRAIESRAHLPS